MLKTIKITFVSIAATIAAYGAYTGIKGSLERSTDFKRLDAIAGVICVSSGIGAASATILFDLIAKTKEKKKIDALIQDLTTAMELVTPDTSAKLLDVVESLSCDEYVNNGHKVKVKTK